MAIKTLFSSFSIKQKLMILPFAASVMYYIIQPHPHTTIRGAFSKVIPIIYLIVYIIVTNSGFLRVSKSLNKRKVLPQDAYSSCILIGLCVAMVGDFLQGCPYLVVPRGILFLIVHMAYYCAIEFSGRHEGLSGHFRDLFALLFLNTWLCTQSSIDSFFMKAFVLLYYILLFLTSWKSFAALHKSPENKATKLAAIGASCFMISDFILILDFTGVFVPWAEGLYMAAYYVAQMGWAFSTAECKGRD